MTGGHDKGEVRRECVWYMMRYSRARDDAIRTAEHTVTILLREDRSAKRVKKR